MKGKRIRILRLWFCGPRWCLGRTMWFFWHDGSRARRLHTSLQSMIRQLLGSLEEPVVGIENRFSLVFRVHHWLFWQIHRPLDGLELIKNVLLRWNGALWINKSVDRWYLAISLKAAFPGLALLFFGSLTPVVTGADFLEIFWLASPFLTGSVPLTFYDGFDWALERGIVRKLIIKNDYG